MHTYSFTTSELPGEKAEVMLDSLSAQKYFLLNGIYRFTGLPAGLTKNEIKTANEIRFSGAQYDEETMALMEKCKEGGFYVFTHLSRGNVRPVGEIIAWASQITQVMQPKHIALRMTQSHIGMMTMEEGVTIRPALGFQREDSPIYLSTFQKKTPFFHAFLMLMGCAH